MGVEGVVRLNLSQELEMKEAETHETEALMHEALLLGIDIPERSDWWREDKTIFDNSTAQEIEHVRRRNFFLTAKGKAGVKKLIKDEKRKNVEWWFKIVGSIIALITGLLGALIGVLAFLMK